MHTDWSARSSLYKKKKVLFTFFSTLSYFILLEDRQTASDARYIEILSIAKFTVTLELNPKL
jgi:hypothetical protein